jgi:hypothetical protein
VNPHAVLTFAHGQNSGQRHRRCRSAGPGRGAAGQHDADDARVRLGCGCGCEYYLMGCGCVAVSVAEWGPPRPWPLLTLAHGQPWWQQHRRCRRAGPGRGAAGQHDADDAGVRLGCGCGLGPCGCVEVAMAERERNDLSQCSHLLMADFLKMTLAMQARGT